MEFKGQGESVGGKLILCDGDLTMSFSSNLFLFYLVFSFKELKLFLELNAFYVILVGDCMVNLFTYELVFNIDHMLKYSSSCAFLEKKNLCKICNFFRTFVENGYDERVHCFFCTLCSDFHAKFKGEFVEICDYESSFLYASKKNFDGFIPSIKLLCFHLSRINEGTLQIVENLSLYYHHPFKETIFQTLDLLDLLLELEKNKSFYYHLSFKDVDVNIFFDLQEFNTFNCASFWRILVNFDWLLNTPFWKESFQSRGRWYDLESEGTVELLQGPVTRAMARRMEEEHRGKITRFKKMIQDLAWQVIGYQEEDFKRSKTMLWSSV
ncbi:hypothetical protein M9H77_31332 [Catharanthus roseus]|uniref:Uncharacterized protein n=1 Tax=Catharanthus roseus TaxID=4058 RepID=A0ACB9ZZT0_CATRO|nr:hypothetical protein M9H77_31332 [Catharanthus roseus]